MRGKDLYFVVVGTHHPRFLLNLLLWNINISSKCCIQMHPHQHYNGVFYSHCPTMAELPAHVNVFTPTRLIAKISYTYISYMCVYLRETVY